MEGIQKSYSSTLLFQAEVTGTKRRNCFLVKNQNWYQGSLASSSVWCLTMTLGLYWPYFILICGKQQKNNEQISWQHSGKLSSLSLPYDSKI